MIKQCNYCSDDFYVRPSHAEKRSHCSTDCHNEARRVNLIKLCPVCLVPIKGKPSFVLKRAYCSRKCMAQDYKEKKKKTAHKSVCSYCGNEFTHSPSKDRKYCSYQCHLDSGGAIRAGQEAVKTMKKYGLKKDANHNDIVKAFKKLGADVIDLSNLGCGVPDILVWCKGAWHLIDIKNPETAYGKRGLNPLQKTWAADWKGGAVYLVYNNDDVVNMVNGNLDKVKCEGIKK